MGASLLERMAPKGPPPPIPAVPDPNARDDKQPR
jgi:hypothetical protein